MGSYRRTDGTARLTFATIVSILFQIVLVALLLFGAHTYRKLGKTHAKELELLKHRIKVLELLPERAFSRLSAQASKAQSSNDPPEVVKLTERVQRYCKQIGEPMDKTIKVLEDKLEAVANQKTTVDKKLSAEDQQLAKALQQVKQLSQQVTKVTGELAAEKKENGKLKSDMTTLHAEKKFMAELLDKSKQAKPTGFFSRRQAVL